MPVVLQRGVRLRGSQRDQRAAAVTRLLTELAQRRAGRILSLVDDTPRDFERRRVDADSVLPNENEASFLRHRDDGHPVAADERVNLAGRAEPAVQKPVPHDVENSAARDRGGLPPPEPRPPPAL